MADKNPAETSKAKTPEEVRKILEDLQIDPNDLSAITELKPRCSRCYTKYGGLDE